MAQTDLQQFLEDLLVRFNPDLDISQGSRAQTEVIQPIIERVGSDPFDDDIQTFVQDRVRQAFPDLAISDIDALTDTLIDPMRVLLDPIVREIKLVKLRASIRNADSLSDDEVDALMANFFEPRRSGAYATGVVRAFYANPQTVSFTIANPGLTGDGLRYFPTVPQQITADQMLLNVDGPEYYFDVNYTAEQRGDQYNIDAGAITSVANMPSATHVTNLRRFRDGAPHETSQDYIARVSQQLSDHTLTVIRGILAELFDNFPTLEKVQVIGMGDAEMERDVVDGGGLGGIISAGPNGFSVDDGNGDGVTPIIEASGADFINDVGSVGSTPNSFYLSIFYIDPSTAAPVIRDVKILEILSVNHARLDWDLPNPVGGFSGIMWMLRRKQITISGIPGGIVFPDSVSGTIEIDDGSVHIGGKTDIYVGGVFEPTTTQITSLTDEEPLDQGTDAWTGNVFGQPDVVQLQDRANTAIPDVATGMSFVLEEGVDVGSYLIKEIIRTDPVLEFRLNVALTGTQTNLVWKIVDDIDTTLTEPKDIKAAASDLLTVAGNPNVTTLSALNFVDANVQPNDTLRITDANIGGDYKILTVGPTTLVIDPAPQRSVPGAKYQIFRLSPGVQPPIVRIRSLELLDSSGAPVGAIIPYRNPVLAQSRAFQNSGNELLYQGRARLGLVTAPFTGGLLNLGGKTLRFDIYDASKPYAGILISYLFTFGGGFITATQAAGFINADGTLTGLGVRASVLTYEGNDYVGIYSAKLVIMDKAGTANATLGFNNVDESRNTEIRGFPENVDVPALVSAGVRGGDLVSFIGGGFNTGFARIQGIVDVNPGTVYYGQAYVGDGPTANYEVSPLFPEIGVNIQVGRPSIGSARVYFTDPTSVEFPYMTSFFGTTLNGQSLRFRPDPENLRIVQPAPPLTTMPSEGLTDSTFMTLTDTTVDFLSQGIRPGDVLDLVFQRITGTPLAAPPTTILVAGLTLLIGLDNGPLITVSFPFNQTRDLVAAYVNTQVGFDLAFINGSGSMYFEYGGSLLISPDSTALAALNLFSTPSQPATNTHGQAGRYIIAGVTATVLTMSPATPFGGFVSSVANSQYRIQRYVQRVSSTEMNSNLDETQLYYADVELVSEGPGNAYNIASGITLAVTGHISDGFELSTDNTTTSFSRAEVLRAHISRSILFVGSSDSPTQYVQLSQQNVQVNYDRSQLVDDIQSFCDSDQHRVVNEDILVRHLLPYFVNLNWKYTGGDLIVTMVQAITDDLSATDADEQLEVGTLVNLLRQRGAVSVFSPDPQSPTGRNAPIIVVIFHGIDRTIGGMVVTDFTGTGRLQRFIADSIQLARISPTTSRF